MFVPPGLGSQPKHTECWELAACQWEWVQSSRKKTSGSNKIRCWESKNICRTQVFKFLTSVVCSAVCLGLVRFSWLDLAFGYSFVSCFFSALKTEDIIITATSEEK